YVHNLRRRLLVRRTDFAGRIREPPHPRETVSELHRLASGSLEQLNGRLSVREHLVGGVDDGVGNLLQHGDGRVPPTRLERLSENLLRGVGSRLSAAFGRGAGVDDVGSDRSIQAGEGLHQALDGPRLREVTKRLPAALDKGTARRVRS